MKKILLALLLNMLVLQGFSQSLVYFDFVTHNEETSQWAVVNYYSANRTKLITLSNYFQANGITWNMQSDWRYLNSVLMNDTAFFSSTNNKNILRWMHEDKGVEMDPHAHESVYIYPDVVKLMDSLQLPESKLMGGTIYNDSNGVNIWTNLVNGQNGIIYPNKFWKPDYMMGGGTPNHIDDLKYYGIWNPQSPTSYLTHDTSSHLRHMGVGCTIKIYDTSNVVDVVAQLKDFIQKVQNGLYPANGFYLQTIFFEQGDLNNTLFYNKVLQVADSANAIVNSGAAQWKTLKQAYTQWETTYNKQMFQWNCGEIVSLVNDVTENKISVYPNPVSDKIIFELNAVNGKNISLKIFNVLGEIIFQTQISKPKTETDFSSVPSGIYFYQLLSADGLISSGKMVKE